MASWTNGWWIDGGNRMKWVDGHHKLWAPSNSITTVFTHSLIHSLMAHLLILVLLGKRWQEGFTGVSSPPLDMSATWGGTPRMDLT